MHDLPSGPRPVVLTELSVGGRPTAPDPRHSPAPQPLLPVSFTIRRQPEQVPPSWQDLLGER
jgi:hypothetical protein